MPVVPLESDSGGVQLPVQLSATNSIMYRKQTNNSTRAISQFDYSLDKRDIESLNKATDKLKKICGRVYKIKLDVNQSKNDSSEYSQIKDYVSYTEVAEEVKISSELPKSSPKKPFKLKEGKNIELFKKTKKIKFASSKTDIKKYQRLITSLDLPLKQKERVGEMIRKVKVIVRK